MLRWLFLFVCVAMAADTPAAWTPSLSMQVQSVDDVTPSPDGRLVLWTQKRARMDPEHSEFVTQIFLAHADGSARIQLTRGEKGASAPQFSPDGRFIFFLSDRTGKKNLYRIPVNGGEAEMLTEWKGAIGAYKVSPDGKRVAFTATDEDKDAEKRKKEKNDYKVIDDNPHNMALYVKPIDTEEPARARQLVDNKHHIGWFDWSPDGQRIAYEHHPTASLDDGRLSDIAEVEVTGGTVTDLVNTKAPESHPIYSPDGRYIAFVRGAGQRSEVEGQRIMLLTRAGGALRELPATRDESPNVVDWTADSKSILFSESKGVRNAIFSMPIDGKPAELWGPERGAIGPVRLSASASAVGFAMQTPEEPPEAYVASLAASTKPVRVSAANTSLPKPPLGRTELIRWKSKDGKEIEGLLTWPVGYQAGTRVPLILNVHGGPAGAFGESFLGSSGAYPLAAWSAKGIAVLRPNPRGSAGYGRDFRKAAVEDWGGMAFQDLMTGVDHVIGMGVADPEKMGIMGWSYGGYMTAWAITQTTRFKAAAIGAGITNTVSMYGTQDIPSVFEDYFGGTPWEKPGIYAKNSPLEFVTRVKTPTLIQHGEADPRVPVTQGYEYYRALKKLGVPVKMVVYPRMPHGAIEPKFTQHIMEEHLEWAEKYLR